MKDAMQDATAVQIESTASRKRVKPKILKGSALDAGLAALAALESSDTATKPVQATARTLVAEGIESIMRLRSKNVPMLRIYNDLRKAAGLRIGFGTFVGYVSEASKAAGLRPTKASKEAVPTPRPRPDAEPAATAVEASTMVEEVASVAERAATVAAQVGGSAWGCSRCETESTRTVKEDKAWWRCPGCMTFWADDDGKIIPKRLNAKKEG